MFLTSAIHLKRDVCVLTSCIQTPLEITLVHGMPTIAIESAAYHLASGLLHLSRFICMPVLFPN